MTLTSPASPYQITPHGIAFHSDINFEEWKSVLTQFKTIHDHYHNGLADLLTYGRAKFGDESVSASLEQLEFPLAEVNKAHAIGQLSFDFRSSQPALTSEHFYVLSRVDDPIERERWANLATTEDISPSDLRHSIGVGHLERSSQRRGESGFASGIASIQAVGLGFERWKRQVGGLSKVLTLPEYERREILSLLDGFIEFAGALEESLNP